MYKIDSKKYIITFLITAGLFATAFFVSNMFSGEKVKELQSAQDRVAIDILSSEMQFSLLAEASCENVGNSSLSTELSSLGTKVAYAENQFQSNSDEVKWLKKNYSLLEMKDYLLTKKIADRCKTKPVSILYFYSNIDGQCNDCKKMGYVLTELHNKYPGLRVYSFDYDLDLSALQTLISLHKVKKELPALIIDGKTYQSFKSVEDVEKLMPELAILKEKADAAAAAKAATSTKTVK
jgi:hypothetical protein